MPTGFPRYFKIGGAWINAYKVLLCVGIYVGSLTSAALAEQSGHSPLAIGLGAMASALAGLAGARIYHVLINARHYFGPQGPRLWDGSRGGWGVFGALITFVPASIAAASLAGVAPAVFWDHAAGGVLTGGFWIRMGCVFNGCCAGRATDSVFGVRLHDTRMVRTRRVPVQFLEMAWWAAGSVVFLAIWPAPLPHGSYALGVLGWYGAGRFVLEPMREHVEVIFGRVPINQAIAGLLAVASAMTLYLRH
jgi:prolipoprotein diacylglyceryltransferase